MSFGICRKIFKMLSNLFGAEFFTSVKNKMLEIRFDINNVSSKTTSSERVPIGAKKTGILTDINIGSSASSYEEIRGANHG